MPVDQDVELGSRRHPLPDRAVSGGKLIDPLGRDDDYIDRRLAPVVDGREEQEDQAANRQEMQQRLAQEPPR